MADPQPLSRRDTLVTALALALGAAVSLGLARFSYALLLPAMRADLGWSYATAGAMNTINAAGYLAGALAMPRLLARWGARRALVGGSVAASLLLAGHALAGGDATLYLLRAATGLASAAVFVAGGLMAARLSLRAAPGLSPGLLLGLYYGGTGLGIVASALLLPGILAGVPGPGGAAWPAWRAGWLVLATLGLLATVLMARFARDDESPPAGAMATAAAMAPFPRQRFGFGLLAYFLFGLGYIGYMTFIITLLKAQQLSTTVVVLFYTLLGAGVMASPWLWARLLQRQRGGLALAWLSGLLALATALPALLAGALPALLSGTLFGAVFLSVVASTTALVRHNLPQAGWPAGISAFTVVFAFGQIIGPVAVGWLSDGAGGLRTGLLVSAAVLLGGALVAALQRPLAH